MDNKQFDDRNIGQLDENQNGGNSKMNNVQNSDGKENVRKTSFIKNPLPLPKKHVKKEMEYDFEVSPDQMHFDIENPDKNYYDI